MRESLNVDRSIRTISGQYVNVFDPNPDTLLIEDIAHALSNQCRFGGHLPRFYSVAQHSYLCYKTAPENEKFNALMHDASEAYLLDFPSPIKMEIQQYKEIEDNLMTVLAKKFGFEYPKSKIVSKVDYYLLEWEWNIIMLGKKKTTYPKIKCMTPKQSADAFLKAFAKETIKRA